MRLLRLLLLLAVPAACRLAPPARPVPATANVAGIERRFLVLRDLRDALDVAEARGVDTVFDGRSRAVVEAAYGPLRDTVHRALSALDTLALAPDDRRAAAAMRVAMDAWLPAAGEASTLPGAVAEPLPCTLSVVDSLERAGYAAMSAWLYACYGNQARRVIVGRDTVDRLTILERLRTTDDPAERRRFFLALEPVWRSVNFDNSARSPFRRFIPLSAARWKRVGSPIAANLAALGIAPDTAARWLGAILETWRVSTPDTPIEPWDFYYAAGAASRSLRGELTRDSLAPLNRRYFRDIGADPDALGVRYDLLPREGKTPVAFTTFGRRGRFDGGRWIPTEPWVFATYRVGGFDNLGELFHETGHAIHIAAIRGRPAYVDWPDSDPLSEALGDLPALDVYERGWQERYLGTTVPAAASYRAKYASIVLDVAWALFEIRMHEDPSRDPNAVWSELTSRYLHIRPHPEWSWWMLRGQIVHIPGYMMNYAVGAVVIMDLRARVTTLRGPMWCGDAGLYAFLAERIYRFGQARGSGDVVRDFLGRPVSVEPILEDMRRGLRGEAPSPACPVSPGNR